MNQLRLKMNNKVLFRHILIWVIFILYELSVIKITAGVSAPFTHYSVFYLLNICLFYFNAHVILDYAFFRTSRPYVLSALLITGEIFAFLLIKLYLESYLSPGNPVSFAISQANVRLWLTNIFREIFFIGFSIAYWSMLYMVKFKEKNHAMERDYLRNVAHSLELENKYISVENAYLQNQISPHLLFNTLNFLYNTVHRLSDRAGKGVMLLADIMRYSLVSSADQRLVPLKDEFLQIEKLVGLTQLRFEQALYLRVVRRGSMKDVHILPLVLVTLVENMIKHGDLGEPDHPGLIRLTVANGVMKFETHNKKRPGSPHLKNGIGLANIRKRLNNKYPERYTFDVLENDRDFTAILKLHL